MHDAKAPTVAAAAAAAMATAAASGAVHLSFLPEDDNRVNYNGI